MLVVLVSPMYKTVTVLEKLWKLPFDFQQPEDFDREFFTCPSQLIQVR